MFTGSYRKKCYWFEHFAFIPFRRFFKMLHYYTNRAGSRKRIEGGGVRIFLNYYPPRLEIILKYTCHAHVLYKEL